MKCRKKGELYPYRFFKDLFGRKWVEGKCCGCGTYYRVRVK